MQNKEIVKAIKLTAQLMELHDENPFKIKSLNSAAFNLDNISNELEGLTLEQLERIEGVGKSIASKINELQTTGELMELNILLKKTPLGVIEMMSIKGIGPKKVRLLWKELEVESIGELLQACHENRLITVKGFGAKTQEQVKKGIEFKLSSLGKYKYATAEQVAFQVFALCKEQFKTNQVVVTGALRRKCEIIEKLEIILVADNEPNISTIENPYNIPISFILCQKNELINKLFETTATPEHLEKTKYKFTENPKSENEIYASLNLQYIEPELREGLSEVELAKQNKLPKLIELNDLKGVLHNHSTYSDGIHTLKEMAYYCKDQGYEYLGICDHSQSAFYANGLKVDRVINQQNEITKLNLELSPFKILKGIESDILYDGSLDYPEEILKTFDLVVASIHSVLKMDIDKATTRLIKAIENPYTTILGHPTGRLILSREGYPIDHKKVIDACAANNVIIELNAHPYRLDIDWRWIPYCIEKGVKISINPDAHEKEGYHDMYYGVCVARKGMLTKEMCFNSLTLSEIEKHLQIKKSIV